MEYRELTAVTEKTIETYGIENWGADYFGVNRKGNLIVRSPEDENLTADVYEVVVDLQKRGVDTPILLRFPQLLFGQIRKLQTAFKKAIREFEYQGGHLCVYPMKVNQNRTVVEEYLKEGSRYDFGLEAGGRHIGIDGPVQLVWIGSAGERETHAVGVGRSS